MTYVVSPQIKSPTLSSPFLAAAVMRRRLVVVDLALSWSPGTRLCKSKRLQLRAGTARGRQRRVEGLIQVLG